MSTAWLGVLIAALAVIQGFVVFLRGEQVRKQGVSAAWRTRLEKRLDELEGEFRIVQLRLQPLFTVMDQRLAMMFHQPDAEFAWLDRLIERYHADPDPLRRSLSDRDLYELTQGIYWWFEQTAKGGPQEDAGKHGWAALFCAHLDGLRAERAYRRMRAHQDLSASQTQEPPPSWWPWIWQRCLALYKWFSRS